jgi:hypothetical protein
MKQTLAVVQGFGVAFTTPRALPKPAVLPGRVVVLDIAFAFEGGGRTFEKTTLRFIEALGERLVGWVDHHDSRHHQRYATDPRFVLATKAEHGACPEMISPELVARLSPVDTIVCHTDFDGLASAAKWIRNGQEPYPGCDADARAVDTCQGELGAVGRRIERALRAHARDPALLDHVLRLLVAGARPADSWEPVDQAAEQLAPLEHQAELLAQRFELVGADLALVDASAQSGTYDKTTLLLLGQERARMAAVLDGDTVTFAAPFDSGVDFVSRFGFSGGMPTRVSVRRSELGAALRALGVADETVARWERVAPSDLEP